MAYRGFFIYGNQRKVAPVQPCGGRPGPDQGADGRKIALSPRDPDQGGNGANIGLAGSRLSWQQNSGQSTKDICPW